MQVMSDYTPDIESQPWYTAAYPYQAPDAPEPEDDTEDVNEGWL